VHFNYTFIVTIPASAGLGLT